MDRVVEAEPEAFEPAEADAEADHAALTEIAPKKQPPAPRRKLRLALLLAGPLLVLLVGGYFYLTGGRYVSTDDAYVKADKVAVTAEVSGRISDVAVKDNEHVEQGALLFRIDPAKFQIALARADAQLASTRAELESLKASYREKEKEVELARTNFKFAQRDFKRRSELAEHHVVSRAALDEATHALDSARQRIAVEEQGLAQIRAQLGGDPAIATERHPRYLMVKAVRDQAALDLSNATVRAPFAGVVGNKPQLGQYVDVGTAVMSLVADDGQWIEANFKETDLTNVRPGQRVSISIDTYPALEWSGSVASISQATGAEFSVLPPQNATGNWVKIVQRIPVRIAVEKGQGAPALRAGMSAVVEIDTKGARSGIAALAAPGQGNEGQHTGDP